MRGQANFRDDELALRYVVDLLNTEDPKYGETAEELLRLIGMWMSSKRSGPDFLKKLYAGDTQDKRRAMQIQRGWKASLIPSDAPNPRASSPIRLPIGSGLDIVITPSPRSEQQQLSRKEKALFHFLSLLVYSQSDMLGGPCAYERCSRYYIMHTKRQTVYCSKECANKGSATNAARKERKDKLSRAEAALQKWVEADTDLSWKVFVRRREADITLTFLTRAANKGDLMPPARGSRKTHTTSRREPK